MKAFILLISLGFCAAVQAGETCPELLNFTAQKLRSQESVDFCKAFNGKVILAVNTASQCGFTPQFKGLEALYQKYKDKGLVVLGFPSDDFYQEFNEEEKTAEMCYKNYGVNFPMFKTSTVTGDGANAFFRQLAKQAGEGPKWNFHKYLIDRQGRVVLSVSSVTPPEDAKLNQQIEALIQ